MIKKETGLYHIIDEKPKFSNQVCEEIDECQFGNKGIYSAMPYPAVKASLIPF